MLSGDEIVGPAGHWHPHILVYLPYYENLLGNKHPQSPLPSIGDDEGTPFAVGVIPVDDKLAERLRLWKSISACKPCRWVAAGRGSRNPSNNCCRVKSRSASLHSTPPPPAMRPI